MTKCEITSRGYCIAIMNVIGLGAMFCLLCITLEFSYRYAILDISVAFKVATILGLILCFVLFIFCFVASCINDRTLHMITTGILALVAIASFGFGLGLIVGRMCIDETLDKLISNISRNYDQINRLEWAFSCCRWGDFVDPQCMVQQWNDASCFENIPNAMLPFLLHVVPGFFGITLCLIICLITTCCLFCRENRATTEYTSQAGVSLNQLSHYGTVDQTLVPQDDNKAYGQTW